MAEYIERETAVAWFMPYAHAGESIDADVVISDIKGMKAADVAPVRHARWEECHWVEQDGPYSLVAHPKAAFRCSGCKYVFKKELLWKDNYCPNCGARMDIEGNGGAVFK